MIPMIPMIRKKNIKKNNNFFYYNYNKMSKVLGGEELVIDGKECNCDFLDNKEYLQKFIDELVILGNMNKIGDTQFEYFPYTHYNIENDLCGYTIFQCISVSSIVIHIAEISKTVYFNFHTCKYLPDDNVVELFKKYFKPKSLRRRIINRDMNF